MTEAAVILLIAAACVAWGYVVGSLLWGRWS